ncbi:uncharacterized protein LDX57_004932 [Aspergillus melleus]|uniref:uncharacterized protein n=1 Tax=Aspergillus melleus TaxID=138277 RepID=UPI001E8DE33A|nr:uncharacterized protein LDX57_004932 [Aspergillus melleus]KAH8427218.1 hypothetical protein LDX57_004932 [Aspergillus melleus]
MADCWQPQPSWAGSHWYQGQPSLRSSTFRNLVSAFPRPRQTGRVTKPRSAGNSPTYTGRRRTTVSNSSPMYRHLPTQDYQAPYDPALLAAAFHRSTATRPTSWHPASLGTVTYPENFPTTAQNNMGVMEMASQPLDISPPVMTNGNMLQPYPLSNIPMSNDPCFPDMQYTTPIQQPSFMEMSASQVDPIAWDTNEAHTSSINQPMSDNWAFDMMSMNNSMPSADVGGSGYASAPSSGCLSGPSTPDFLPIQQPDDNSLPLSAAPKPKVEEELVGMGLYNHPESLFETSFEGLPGKGLKLEETFTPSAENEADDTKDAENEDDDEQETGTEQNPAHIQPSLYQPVKSTGNMMHKSFFFDDDDLDQHAVPASQQIFNLGSQPCMNYGYGWI